MAFSVKRSNIIFVVFLRFTDLHLLLPDDTLTVLVDPPRFKLDLNPVNVDRIVGWALVLRCLDVVGMAQQGLLRPAVMLGERIAEKDIISNTPCCHGLFTNSVGVTWVQKRMRSVVGEMT